MNEHRPLISTRAMLILLLAAITAGTTAMLAAKAEYGWPATVLIAGAAAAGAIGLFNAILD